MSTAIDQMKFEDLEREMLSPLRGLALTPDELFVATMLLEATAARPMGIKRLQRALAETGSLLEQRQVKAIVRALRKRHELPIISRRKEGGGIWWCENEEQMKEYIEHAGKQPKDQWGTLHRMVRRNYPKLAGQMRLIEE